MPTNILCILKSSVNSGWKLVPKIFFDLTATGVPSWVDERTLISFSVFTILLVVSYLPSRKIASMHPVDAIRGKITSW